LRYFPERERQTRRPPIFAVYLAAGGREVVIAPSVDDGGAGR
jgi:hypothetical protein